jgi:hypothetical protein
MSPNDYVRVGQWQHIAVTFNGSCVGFYRNGLFSLGVYRPPGTLAVTLGLADNLNIGSRSDAASGTRLSGMIDQVRVFNRVLDSATIASLACQSVPQATLISSYGLIAGFDFDSASWFHVDFSCLLICFSVLLSSQFNVHHWRNLDQCA